MTSRWRRDSAVERPVEVDPLPVGTGAVAPRLLGVGVGLDPLPATPAVDRQVAGHPHDPRLGVAADLPPADERTRQGLLGDVLGLAAPSEELVGHAVGPHVEVLECLLEHEVDGDRRDGRGVRLVFGFDHVPEDAPGSGRSASSVTVTGRIRPGTPEG